MVPLVPEEAQVLEVVYERIFDAVVQDFRGEQNAHRTPLTCRHRHGLAHGCLARAISDRTDAEISFEGATIAMKDPH